MAYLSARPAQLAADHPLEATVGAGVVIDGTVAASAVAAEVLLLRLASGLRWAGALRPALALSRVTWSGAETELVGARAAWQGYQTTPWQASVIKVMSDLGYLARYTERLGKQV